MHGALLVTLLVGCGSAPAPGSSPPSTSDPGTSGASANGKTPVDPASSTTPMRMGTPTQDPAPATTPATTPAPPTFAWAPDFADFAETMLGETTKPQAVTLTNTSNVDAAGVGLRLNGSQFVFGANECSGTLPAHGSCKVEVAFEPTLAVAAEGFIYVLVGSATQGEVVVHLTGTGKAPPTDPGMSTPPTPGVYPMCASPVPAGSDWVCGTAERHLKKDGYTCGVCIVGSTQECLPDHSGILCVASCGECQ
jgi:hypothetical protein